MGGGFFKKNGGKRIDIKGISSNEKFADVRGTLSKTTKPNVRPIDLNRKVSLRAEDIVKSFKIGKVGRK
jgi:hypothetical protein